MANFNNGKYILSNTVCTSRECLLGQFDKCPKKHEILIRSPAVNQQEATLTDAKGNKSDDKLLEKPQNCQNDEFQDESDVETVYGEQFDADFELKDNATFCQAEDNENENDADEILISDSESETDEDDSIVYTTQLARNHPEFNVVMQFIHGDLLLNDFICDIESWKPLFQSIERTKRNSVIGYIGSNAIQIFDLETLDNNQWLNDRVINGAMQILKEKSLQSEKPIEIVDTFWLPHYQVG